MEVNHSNRQNDGGGDSGKNNLSVRKVFKIIETMAEYKNPIRLKDLAALTGYNNVTVYRFLETLILCGYVTQDKETLLYSLTIKLCDVASKINQNNILRQIASSHLAGLSKQCAESVGLVIQDKECVRYLDIYNLGKHQQLSTSIYVGMQIPIHATAAGKLFISNYSFWKLGEYFDTHTLERYTEQTITSRHVLGPQLRQVAHRGFTTEDEEFEVGIRSIASPIFNSNGAIVAAINIVGPKLRLTDEYLAVQVPNLVNTAHTISQQLQYNESVQQD